VLLIGVTVGATLFLSGALHSAAAPAAVGADPAAAAPAPQSDQPALYLPLDPPFVVNFENDSTARFLQVSVELMARDPAVLEAVKQHMPAIRNNLVMLFSSQRYESVSTREGKEKVRADVLIEVQKILQERVGQPGVEAAYFTSFVMQ
jgi:flagellar FliL protein